MRLSTRCTVRRTRTAVGAVAGPVPSNGRVGTAPFGPIGANDESDDTLLDGFLCCCRGLPAAAGMGDRLLVLVVVCTLAAVALLFSKRPPLVVRESSKGRGLPLDRIIAASGVAAMA